MCWYLQNSRTPRPRLTVCLCSHFGPFDHENGIQALGSGRNFDAREPQKLTHLKGRKNGKWLNFQLRRRTTRASVTSQAYRQKRWNRTSGEGGYLFNCRTFHTACPISPNCRLSSFTLLDGRCCCKLPHVIVKPTNSLQ